MSRCEKKFEKDLETKRIYTDLDRSNKYLMMIRIVTSVVVVEPTPGSGEFRQVCIKALPASDVIIGCNLRVANV
ncbi:hypothetical protein DERP_001102 [Dermatophagoides pteronyssinus]|uniref:Uncharacterized protein n=1 Tax=Dermatophagoides pteronyssinus TaxID=6956 RepID=A0ABQ8JE95_DERPT|nr:hypothetical protein DERP_001102 [Dermatophagoides pteronyssinus]